MVCIARAWSTFYIIRTAINRVFALIDFMARIYREKYRRGVMVLVYGIVGSLFRRYIKWSRNDVCS